MIRCCDAVGRWTGGQDVGEGEAVEETVGRSGRGVCAIDGSETQGTAGTGGAGGALWSADARKRTVEKSTSRWCRRQTEVRDRYFEIHDSLALQRHSNLICSSCWILLSYHLMWSLKVCTVCIRCVSVIAAKVNKRTGLLQWWCMMHRLRLPAWSYCDWFNLHVWCVSICWNYNAKCSCFCFLCVLFLHVRDGMFYRFNYVNEIYQFLARDVIYTSRTYAMMPVCPSVCDGSALAHYS